MSEEEQVDFQKKFDLLKSNGKSEQEAIEELRSTRKTFRACIYMGAASPEESECPQAVKEALENFGFSVSYCGDGAEIDIPTALLSKPDIYVQPGGGDDMVVAWEGVSSAKSAIVDYVHNGGHYVGICMGSFLSSKGDSGDGFDGYDLLTSAGWDAVNYIEREKADVKDMDQTLVQVIWRGKPESIFFQGGPSFVRLDETVANENEVILASYSNGDAAAIVVPYGKGKVGVTGPHPEATESWYTDVADAGGPQGKVVHNLFIDLVKTTMA